MGTNSPLSGSNFGLSAVVITIVVTGTVWWSIARSANISSKEQLDKVATKLNQRTPLLVDKSTELSNAMAEEGVLIYNYRLVNLATADVPPDALTVRLKPLVTNNACTTPESRNGLLNRGVTLRYRYYDKDKSYIGEFDVKATDCH